MTSRVPRSIPGRAIALVGILMVAAAGFAVSRLGEDPVQVSIDTPRLVAPFACGDRWTTGSYLADTGSITYRRDLPLSTEGEPIFAMADGVVTDVEILPTHWIVTIDHNQIEATYSKLRLHSGPSFLGVGSSIGRGEGLGRVVGDAVEIALLVNGTPPGRATSQGDAVVSRNCQGDAASHFATTEASDFDGDGLADRVDTVGSSWRFTFGDRSDPIEVDQAAPLSDVAFGDFTGDGTTDILWMTGDEWLVANGGTDPWSSIRTSPLTLNDVLFGDFNGDRRMDVFTGDGSAWLYSPGGSSPWRFLRASEQRAQNLSVIDVDGDGTSDVFQSTGAIWRASEGALQPWRRLATTIYELHVLRFGDINGDGVTDVLRLDGDTVMIAWSARPPWVELLELAPGFDQLIIRDHDLDGRDEVLVFDEG